MIHMLSAFDLKEGEEEAGFLAAYEVFLDDLRREGLIVSASPPGLRVADTPMDTDEARSHTRFSMLVFKDRAQLDGAYALIARHRAEATSSHNDMYARITNSVFLCWQDQTPNEET